MQDRALPARAVYGSPEATDEDNDVESCVATPLSSAGPAPDLWTPVRRIDGGPVPLLLTRIGDQYVGVCALAPDGPTFVVAPMPLWEGSTAEPDDLAPPPSVAFAVDANGVYGFDQTTGYTAVAPCVDAQGIAVCGDPSSQLTVRLATPSEDLTVSRAPGR